VQSITFRLADALPRHVVEALASDPEALTDIERSAKVEAYLNAGHGACHLREAPIGELVEQALLRFEGERYRLIAWVVMPNHVHALMETFEGYPLPGILHTWKSFTASAANALLGRKGAFWFPDYFDRFIRDGRHLSITIAYIHDNPVRAGLVIDPAAWPFSSARLRVP
jgi:putative DNA methylase